MTYVLIRPYDGLARAVVQVSPADPSRGRPARFENRQRPWRCVAVRSDAARAAALMFSIANTMRGYEVQLVGDAALAPFERERHQREANENREKSEEKSFVKI